MALVMVGVKGDSESSRKACKAFVLRRLPFGAGAEAQEGTGDASQGVEPRAGDGSRMCVHPLFSDEWWNV